jgi:biotin carboxylase
MKTTRIAVVDPIVSSAYLAHSLRKCGFESIAILNPHLAKKYKYFYSKMEPFDYDYLVRLDYSQKSYVNALHYLKKLDPKLIIYGAELSIPYADRIIQQLTPDSMNDINKSIARQDKYEMYQSLSQQNLPYGIRQVRVKYQDLARLREKIKKISFPSYIKPALSICTVDGFICRSFEEIEQKLQAYFSRDDIKSIDNNSYVVQELIVGTEYCIDTVSYNGTHHIVGLCEYQKKHVSGKAVPYTTHTIASDSFPLWKEVQEFIRATLTGLGYRYGFAHTEFFIQADGTIKLIEVNCRISGGIGYINKLFELSHGSNAVDVLKHVMTNNVSIKQPFLGHAMRLYIHNWDVKDRSFNAHNVEKLINIASYRDHVVFYPEQTLLQPVAMFKQIYDSIGQILLFNIDKTKLEQDVKRIELLFEKKQIF